MSQKVIFGEVGRISGSGNAILRQGDNEYNLGPTGRALVGKQVLAVPLSNMWAFCLTPSRDMDRYIRSFIRTTGFNRLKLEKKVSNVLSSIPSSKLDGMFEGIPTVDLRSESIERGDRVDLVVAFSTVDSSHALLEDGRFIWIESPMLEVGRSYSVRMRNVDRLLMTATLLEEQFKSNVSLGEILDIVVESRTDSTGYGRINGLPVELSEIPANVGDTVRVGVEKVGPTVITASIEALPSSDRPVVGDVKTVEVRLPHHEETTLFLRDGLPILVTGGRHTYEGEAEIKITEINRNQIRGELDFRQFRTNEFDVGSIVTLSGVEQQVDCIVGYYGAIPVGIHADSKPTEIPNELIVTVEQFDTDGIVGRLKSHPGLDDVNRGDLITIDVESVEEGYIYGNFRDIPICVPFEEPIKPDTLTIQMSEVVLDGIRGILPSFSTSDFSEPESVVIAHIVGDHPYGRLAQVGVESDEYVNPIVIPNLFQPQSDVAVTLQSQAPYLTEGTIVGWQTGEEWSRLKPEFVHLQRALFATRREAYAEATEHWKKVSETAADVYFQADARRGSCFAAVECAMSEDDFESAHSLLDDLEQRINVTLTADKYRCAIENEITAYQKLVEATKRAGSGRTSGVSSLQKLAVNFGFLPLLKEAIIDLRNSMEMGQPDELGFNPIFPHPIVRHRIKQLAGEFEQEPEDIRRFLDGAQVTGELSWPLSATVLEDPLTDEVLDIDSVEAVFEFGPIPNTSQTTETISAEDDSADRSVDTPESEKPAKSMGTDSVITQDPDYANKGEKVTDARATDGETEKTVTTDSPGHSDDADLKPSGRTTNVDKSATPIEPSNLDPDTDPRQRSISDSQLRRLRLRAEADASDDPIRDTSGGGGSRYQRSMAIKVYVKARAGGICEACGEPAPFQTPNGEPYLEAHHVDELGDGGADHPDKVVAICPTCHKRIHHGVDGDMVNASLREKLESGLASEGTK